jgi:hypothetical protein
MQCYRPCYQWCSRSSPLLYLCSLPLAQLPNDVLPLCMQPHAHRPATLPPHRPCARWTSPTIQEKQDMAQQLAKVQEQAARLRAEANMLKRHEMTALKAPGAVLKVS